MDNLTSKAFRDSPKPNDDVPQEILDLMDDIDAEGSAMTVFARAWFRLAVERSFAFVLVDYSTTAPTEAAGAVASAAGVPPPRFSSSSFAFGVRRLVGYRFTR